LRLASRIEAIAVGVIAPVAVVQAYAAHPGAALSPGSLALVLETCAALVAAVSCVVLLVERHREAWSPAARTLVLWPSLVVPAAVMVSARDATTPSLAASVGGAFLAAALVTLVTRIAPVRAASWVLVSGTIGYVALLIFSAASTTLFARPAVAWLAWIVQSAVGIGLLVPPVRERCLRLFEAVAEVALGGGSVRRERLAEQSDRDRGDLVSLL
jgi:hypothetical protein